VTVDAPNGSPVRRLPTAAEWRILGVIDTGQGIINVRHIITLEAAESVPTPREGREVTGILRTLNGICYVYRPWEEFLADYYFGLACLNPKPWHPD